MRKITLLLFCLCLCGCSAQGSLDGRLQAACTQASALTINVHADNVKDLYSYYVEPGVGRRNSTASSNVFVLDNQEFIMNLNIAEIVNVKLYDQTQSVTLPQGERWLSVSEGEFADVQGRTQKYAAGLMAAANGQVMVMVKTLYFTFTGLSNETGAPALAGEMIKIARTATVDEDAVLKAYSSRTKISYVKENLNLFEDDIPENGRLEEMMPNKPVHTGGDIDQSGETFDDGTSADDLPLNENDDDIQTPSESE